MNGAEELSDKIEAHLVRWARRAGMKVDSFRIGCSCPRFSSGDGKGILESSVRGYDLYFVVDVGNYSCTYKYFGQENHMSPDDHFQDLKRLIQAAMGKAHRLTVVMPLLYGGRQHRRSYRESLDCAFALQELQNMGVDNVVTFDAHDPRVQNAVPLMSFDNLMPSYQVLKTMFRAFPDISTGREDFMIVSPDEGALNRNMYYASVLGVELGMFYKRRDYSRVVDGRNPIVAHEYLGSDVAGKDVFVSDDIISSGESMLDIAYNLKERKARRIFTYATYAIFTNGRRPLRQGLSGGRHRRGVRLQPDLPQGRAEEPPLVLRGGCLQVHRLLHLRPEPRYVRFRHDRPPREDQGAVGAAPPGALERGRRPAVLLRENDRCREGRPRGFPSFSLGKRFTNPRKSHIIGANAVMGRSTRPPGRKREGAAG